MDHYSSQPEVEATTVALCLTIAVQVCYRPDVLPGNRSHHNPHFFYIQYKSCSLFVY